jgi:hypothetical protein
MLWDTQLSSTSRPPVVASGDSHNHQISESSLALSGLYVQRIRYKPANNLTQQPSVYTGHAVNRPPYSMQVVQHNLGTTGMGCAYISMHVTW